MRDTCYGRIEMDKLRKELDACWLAPGNFDEERAAGIYAKMHLLLAEGATGTYHQTKRGPTPKGDS